MLSAFLKVESVTNKNTVECYMNAFNELDHEKILSCLTEDVIWEIHGHRKLQGKTEFDAEIENEGFEGKPEITLNRMTEENNVVIAEGTVLAKPKNQNPILLAFCDVFEFENGKIKKLISHLNPINSK
ncbi:nuclear transport factor 2 family protein [Moheibacter sediminis]|uniref:Ketosteroid isomerase-related protein n=1 Tax=Moheibacter sediminis TaxID=1434700 RepID=A0A1W2AHF8_9FLAO|nr:nuclear transport factor 2 family protein [Moheibacter sediminis]SMC59698.1 Ketosteroid isomerase-related protein [Moheibacter sediminis]